MNGTNITPDTYIDHPIRRLAESRGKPKRLWGDSRTELVSLLRRVFDQADLRAWVDAAKEAANRWSERNRKWNAGQDLFDAQRGVYDLAAMYKLVSEALVEG